MLERSDKTTKHSFFYTWRFKGLNSKVPLVAFPVLVHNTLLGQFTAPKFVVLCNGMPSVLRRKTCALGWWEIQHILSATTTPCWLFGVFIAKYRGTLPWGVTLSYLMPLLSYFHGTALTKASISLNIVPVCIFHSCLVSTENSPPLRGALFGREMMQNTVPATKPLHYHLFPFSCKKLLTALAEQASSTQHCQIPATNTSQIWLQMLSRLYVQNELSQKPHHSILSDI